ncbi:MAG: DEAD/DEAH box helicase [Bacteroidetes bacterium]|nr:MAG: DEAD/DEAH box helicase [Bacteroidota bacterium]
MSLELLSEPIRKYIRDKNWESLRPIQIAAISNILSNDKNYILASRTASGKTEAAFLPILSKVDFTEPGVQVLYISPRIALINDQFFRIEELCKYLDISVTKWHGEANRTAKEKLLKAASGIVLTTPESLEAMLVNKPNRVRLLFNNLKFVVIDEFHSFLGTERGIHLSSILFRLQEINSTSFSVIGLSATIGDYEEAKTITGNAANTDVLQDRQAKEIVTRFKYFKNGKEELSHDLLKDLFNQTKDKKVLIFPNNRGRSEEVAVKLKKLSEKLSGHNNYFSHHSSVDKEVREHVEYFAKNTNTENFCISCTSTLELGIDIGTVDEVIQIDTTNSIASLVQRVGRSGRKDDQTSKMFLYATNEWSLMQSIACWKLYEEGYIEPPLMIRKPYDILLHQILSIVKSSSGIIQSELINSLNGNFAFKHITKDEILEIIRHLVETDFLEKIKTELILGSEGENIVRPPGFYSVFKSEENFKVVFGKSLIGEIPYSNQVKEGENIFLAAKIWKIKSVLQKSKKVEVLPAYDGKKTMFYGNRAETHERIREKILELLFSNEDYKFLDEAALEEVGKMRKAFSVLQIRNLGTDRPLIVKDKILELYTFTGTRINRTLSMLFKINEIKHIMDDSSSSFEMEIRHHEFLEKWPRLLQSVPKIEAHIEKLLCTQSAILNFSKWGPFLPMKFRVSLVKERYFDIENTVKWLKKVSIVYS